MKKFLCAVFYGVLFMAGSVWSQEAYQVRTVDDLKLLANASGLFELANDLDLEGRTWTPLVGFKGTFDGKGHSISNLTINAVNSDNVGLFATLDRASVKNVMLFGSRISGRNRVGALVGQMQNASVVSNCFASVSVVGTEAIGGLVGYQGGGEVYGCVSAGAVRSGGNHAGGLVGRLDNGSIRCSAATGSVWCGNAYAGGLVSYSGGGSSVVANCYAHGDVWAKQHAGGFIAHGDGGIMTNCYAMGRVTATSPVGGFSSSLGGMVATGCFWDTQKSEQPTSARGTGLTSEELRTPTTLMDAGWDDDMWRLADDRLPALWVLGVNRMMPARTLGVGSGSVTVSPQTSLSDWVTITAEPDPGSFFVGWVGGGYTDRTNPATFLEPCNSTTPTAIFGKIIDSEEKLIAMRSSSELWGDYRLDRDITLTQPLTPMTMDFRGSFDGAEHAIRQFEMTAPTGNPVGFFRFVEGGVIRNLSLIGTRVTGGVNVGVLAGQVKNAVISNCFAGVSVVASSHAGGLVGRQIGGKILASRSVGDVTTTGIHAGGLVGYLQDGGLIEGCYATGNVYCAGDYAGGLVSYGVGNNVVLDSYARGDVWARSFAGGFTSHGDGGVMTNCYATGRVIASTPVGGFSARASGMSVVGCYWDTETSGWATSAHGTGLTSAEFRMGGCSAWQGTTWILSSGKYPTLMRIGGDTLSPVPTLCLGVGSGTISIDSTPSNGWIRVVATPAEGSFFVRWTGGAYDDPVAAETWLQPANLSTATAVFGKYISTEAELLAFRQVPNAWGEYRLRNDITLTQPLTQMTSVFRGVLDGGGYSIRTVNLSAPSNDAVGFFMTVANATIRNLSLRGGRIEGRDRVGGLVGTTVGACVISNCLTDLEVIAQGSRCGGLVGEVASGANYESRSVFSRCRALGTATAYTSGYVGGLIGYASIAVTLDECMTSGSVTSYGLAAQQLGAMMGAYGRGPTALTNCYTTACLQGPLVAAGTLLGNGGASIVGQPTLLNCFPKQVVNLGTRGNGSGTVSYANGTFTATPDADSFLVRWEGLPPASGEFNETTAYAVFGKKVTSEADLRNLPSQGFFQQTADITMQATPAFAGLHASPAFRGEYDGAGYQIKNLVAGSSGADYGGLFRFTQGAILKRIHLVGGAVQGHNHVGSLVGHQSGGCIEDCSSSVTVYASNIHAGGLIGCADNYARIQRCSATGNVHAADKYAGGLVSYVVGDKIEIRDCYSRGDVTAAQFAGGFMSHGDYDFLVSNCYATGRVNCRYMEGTSTYYYGGFYAKTDRNKRVTGCYWDVTSSDCPRSTYGVGKTTAQLRSPATFVGWEDSIWSFSADPAYPTLRTGEPHVAITQMDGAGNGSVSFVMEGDFAAVTATPADEDSFFMYWGGGDCVDAFAPVTRMRIDGNTAITAVFGKKIRTEADLLAFRTSGDQWGSYKLGNDITLTQPLALSTRVFYGTFDGDGYALNDVVINNPNNDNMGFFYALRDATVKNLTLRGGRIEGSSRVGALAGQLQGTCVISNCLSDLEVFARGAQCGGLVGASYGPLQMQRCRALGVAVALGDNGVVGGLIGQVEHPASVLTECMTSGRVESYGSVTDVIGGLVGKTTQPPVLRNCYTVASLKGVGVVQGTRVGTPGAVYDGSPTILDCFPKNIVHLDTYGVGTGTVARVNGLYIATPAAGSFLVRWDGLPPESGDFNETTARAVFGLEIATEEALRALPYFGDFRQTADIVMQDSPTPFTGLHSNPVFFGEYDGDNHVISNLTINTSSDDMGLFRKTQGAILKNIHLQGPLVKGSRRVGALVGTLVAGMVSNCTAQVEINAYSHAGGLIGQASVAQIKCASSTGAVTTSREHAGGLVGYLDRQGSIEQCFATGNVTCGTSYAGGLVSYIRDNGTSVANCYSRGNVSGASFVGGFMSHGDYVIRVEKCYATGAVTSTSTPVGGFYAKPDTLTVTNCFWDTETSGWTTSVHGTGLTTVQMTNDTQFLAASWNPDIWNFQPGEYPTLRVFAAEDGFDTWAAENGLTGGPDAVTDGVANIFRYAFDRPTGSVPVMSITFVNGVPTVTTPELVNPVTLTLLATEDLTDWSDAQLIEMTQQPDGSWHPTDGRSLASLFFRLRAQ